MMGDDMRVLQGARVLHVIACARAAGETDLDSFEPLLARMLAWDGAGQATLRWLGHDEYLKR